jgi:hypothetical protein
MNAIVYVNTPLEAPEHAALAAMARQEGRAKGQQLRLLAIQAMRGKSGGSGAVIGTAGSDSASASASGSGSESSSGRKERAPSAVSRRGGRGTAGGVLAPAGEARAAAARESKSMSRSKGRTVVAAKGGRV